MAIQERVFTISRYVNHSTLEYIRKIIGLKCELYRQVSEESIYTNMSQAYTYEEKPYLEGRFIVSGLISEYQLQFQNTNYTSITDMETFILFSPKYIDRVELYSKVNIYYGDNIYTYKIQDMTNYMMQNNRVTYMKALIDPIS